MSEINNLMVKLFYHHAKLLIYLLYIYITQVIIFDNHEGYSRGSYWFTILQSKLVLNSIRLGTTRYASFLELVKSNYQVETFHEFYIYFLFYFVWLLGLHIKVKFMYFTQWWQLTWENHYLLILKVFLRIISLS